MDLLRNCNGLSVIAAMQAAVSARSQELFSLVANSQLAFADSCSVATAVQTIAAVRLMCGFQITLLPKAEGTSG